MNLYIRAESGRPKALRNKRTKTPDPFPPIQCECGEVWTQEMHTVCPNCARWPKRTKATGAAEL
jgi:hypothetical protein